MPLVVRKRPGDSDTLDVFSGDFRVGAIKAMEVGGAGAIAHSWVLSTVSVGGNASGTASTVEEAARAINERWQRWLKDARLAEAGVLAAPAPNGPQAAPAPSRAASAKKP